MAKHGFNTRTKRSHQGMGRSREGTDPPGEVQGRMWPVSAPHMGAHLDAMELPDTSFFMEAHVRKQTHASSVLLEVVKK